MKIRCVTELGEWDEFEVEGALPGGWVSWCDFAVCDDVVDEVDSPEEGEPETFETGFAEVGSCDDAHEAVFVCWAVCCCIGFREPMNGRLSEAGPAMR